MPDQSPADASFSEVTAATGPMRQALLATLARQSLTEARTATLLVEGIGRVDPCDAATVLCDRDGRPTLLCPVPSRLAEAARTGCPAMLTVPAAPGADDIGAVIFVGHLHTLGTTGGPAEPTATVELLLASVLIEWRDPTAEHENVALAHYGGHGSSLDSGVALRRAAEQMRLHTNAGHADRLRACVARRAGLPAGEVAAATLHSLDPNGAALDWIDGRGAHRTELAFPEPATDQRTLAAALRGELEAGQ